MSVVIGGRIRHRNVLERERDGGRLVQFQLVERNQRLIFEHSWIDHDRLLRSSNVVLRCVVEIDGHKRRPIVIDERGVFFLHDVHQSAEPKHVVGLGRAGAAGHDQLTRAVAFHVPQHGAQRIGLRDACDVHL